MKTATLGSVSSGTMRTVDLIDTFTATLRELVEGDEYATLIAECDAWSEADPTNVDEENATAEDAWSELGAELVENLFEALQEAAPAYSWFGSHEGDGADYGFWIPDGALDDFDGLRVNDTSEVPADYSGEVLHVNDHGNATLYVATNGALKEVWAIV